MPAGRPRNPLYRTETFRALWHSSAPIRVLADYAGASIVAVRDAGLRIHGPRWNEEYFFNHLAGRA